MNMGIELGRVWVFDEASLDAALAAYQDEALSAYPHQAERIRTTVLAVKDFLQSSHANRLVMSGSRRPQ